MFRKAETVRPVQFGKRSLPSRTPLIVEVRKHGAVAIAREIAELGSVVGTASRTDDDCGLHGLSTNAVACSTIPATSGMVAA